MGRRRTKKTLTYDATRGASKLYGYSMLLLAPIVLSRTTAVFDRHSELAKARKIKLG